MEAGSIIPYSELFRPDTQLNDALELALEKTDPNERFRVISAGCSFGAEIDSILGTVQYNAPRPMAVLGIDCNPRAVEAAQSGRYQMVASLAMQRRVYREANLGFEQTMDTIGFNFNPDPQNPGLHILDTNELRTKHHVRIQEHDLTQILPIKTLAHVVMCNNVLFHLTPDTAEQIVQNLAQHVAPDGILSFGANPAQIRMEANQGMSYLDWLQQMGTKLEQQGMAPALFSQGVAFAFQQAQLHS
jgi:chemotaxis methyl-accepting protein methylase